MGGESEKQEGDCFGYVTKRLHAFVVGLTSRARSCGEALRFWFEERRAGAVLFDGATKFCCLLKRHPCC